MRANIVGMYRNPPDRAIVLWVGQTSRVQALDRTQPVPPAHPGRPEKASHDHVRHGTTSQFAALDVAPGAVIGACQRRYRYQEFLAFLGQIDANVPLPAETAIHVVLDNYGTHEHPRVRALFERHPECVPHFTPPNSSWLNQIERWQNASHRPKTRNELLAQDTSSIARFHTDLQSVLHHPSSRLVESCRRQLP